MSLVSFAEMPSATETSSADPAAIAKQAEPKIVVGRRLEELAHLWPRTDDPKGALCHVFQCADVLAVWLDTIGAARGIEPAFVAVLDGSGKPLMHLALGIERRGAIRVLAFLDHHVSDYNVPILFPDTPDWSRQDFEALWRRIVAALPAFDLASLEKMPADVGGKPNPLLHLGARPWPVSCHLASMPATWEAFAAERIKAPQRFLRYYRQLQKQGAVTYAPAGTDAEARQLLDVLMEQKARRFAETRVPGFESLPGMEAFYREATRRLLGTGVAVPAAVKVGDKIIAVQWGLRFGQRYYYLISGYETGSWEKFSPGRILNEAMLRWCSENGMSIADFGIGDETYKFEYCDTHVPLFEVERAKTAKARAHVAAHRVLTYLRGTRLWQAVRPYKWVLIRSMWRKS